MTKSHAVLCLTASVLFGSSIPACSGSGTLGTGAEPLLQSNDTRSSQQSARPALLIDNSALSRDALWPVLAEIAGKQAIREAVLDHAVSVELDRAGITLTEADIDAERQRLADRLAPESTDEQAEEIVRRVLAGRGLGPDRLGALLRRNAGMRSLIAEEAVPTVEMVELAYQVRFGEQLNTRMITVASPQSAQQVVQAIRSRSQDTGLLLAFIEAASKSSTDPSSTLGGDLGPISKDDPGLPVAIRRELSKLEPMQLSEIIAIDNGYALLLVESITPPAETTLEQVYDTLEQEVRVRQERLLMDQLGQGLLSEYAPSVLDASLRWSWER